MILQRSASPSVHGTRGRHKPGKRPECFAAIKQHAETTYHDIYSTDVKLKEIYINSLAFLKVLTLPG